MPRNGGTGFIYLYTCIMFIKIVKTSIISQFEKMHIACVTDGTRYKFGENHPFELVAKSEQKIRRK